MDANRKAFRALAGTALAAAAAFALALSACSTAPKKSAVVYAERNRASDLSKQGDSLYRQGNYADALSFYRQALEINIGIDNDQGVAISRNAVGKTYAASGADADAREEFATALELAERIGDAEVTAQCLGLIAESDLDSGDSAAALAGVERGLGLAAKDSETRAALLHVKGRCLRQTNDLRGAAAVLEEAAAINKKLGLKAEYASNRYLSASVLNRAGDLDKALSYAQEALAVDKEIENALGIASDYYALAKIVQAKGNDADAYFYLKKSLNVSLVKNLAGETLRALTDLAALADKLGKASEAAKYRDMAAQVGTIASGAKAK
jgi:tetratricopeptide (TPR) repeat protein